MTTVKAIRYREKVALLERNPLTAAGAFKEDNEHDKNCLVSEARKVLKYSDKTNDKDILRSLRLVWKEISKR